MPPSMCLLTNTRAALLMHCKLNTLTVYKTFGEIKHRVVQNLTAHLAKI